MQLHLDFVDYFMRSAADYPPPGDIPPTVEKSRALHRLLASKIGPTRAMEARDFTIAAPHPIPARLYTPDVAGPLPLFLFLHGGGWHGGDLDTHEVLCREIAHGASCAVVAIDYRLAPEHKFPAAYEDAVSAAEYCLENGQALGVDPARVAIGGDSAGGNLAAAATIALRDRGGAQPMFQVLIYPGTDMRMITPAFDDVQGFGLGRTECAWCVGLYLADPEQANDPRASPILAGDFRNLPPAFVMTAECDALRDDGEAYALALARGGVPVRLRRYLGHPHGFLSLPLDVPATVAGIADVSSALRLAFAGVSA